MARHMTVQHSMNGEGSGMKTKNQKQKLQGDLRSNGRPDFRHKPQDPVSWGKISDLCLSFLLYPQAACIGCFLELSLNIIELYGQPCVTKKISKPSEQFWFKYCIWFNCTLSRKGLL